MDDKLDAAWLRERRLNASQLARFMPATARRIDAICDDLQAMMESAGELDPRDIPRSIRFRIFGVRLEMAALLFALTIGPPLALLWLWMMARH